MTVIAVVMAFGWAVTWPTVDVDRAVKVGRFVTYDNNILVIHRAGSWSITSLMDDPALVIQHSGHLDTL